jgi:hypothetical protein
MKQLLFTVFIATSLFVSAAGTKEKTIVNLNLTKNFTARFGEVDNVSWSNAANGMTKATFETDNETHVAFFDESGNYVAETKTLALTDIPKKLRMALEEKAPGAQINNAFEMTTDDEKTWFVETEANGERKVWQWIGTGRLRRYYVAH